jgi:hypothetical protein
MSFCHLTCLVILSVVPLIAVLLIVMHQSAILLSVILLRVVMLNVFLLIIVLISVIHQSNTLLNVILLNVVSDQCHSDKWCCTDSAECYIFCLLTVILLSVFGLIGILLSIVLPIVILQFVIGLNVVAP